VSDKRVQAVLTYAELNELLGQTERGRIEAIAADPVQRRVKIIFGASGCPDGIEPWVFKIDRTPSPPSAYTSESSPEPTSGGGETTPMTYDEALEIWCRHKFPNAPEGGRFFLENCAGGEHGPDVYARWDAGSIVTKETVTTTALWRLFPEYNLQAVMREVFAISGSPEPTKSATGNES
jgi:hypothetical protein